MNNIKIQKDLDGLKNFDLLYLIEDISDLDKLHFLKLDKKILDKLNLLLKENKSFREEFYIWNNKFNKLLIFFHSNNDKKSLIYFLWEQIKFLSKNISIFANKKENLIDLLNCFILWTHKNYDYKTIKDLYNIIFIIENSEIEILAKNRLDSIKNIILARDLWEMPSNILSPEHFVNIVKNTKFKNTKLKILSPEMINKEWLNLLWAVWKWSINKPYMIILERIIDKKFDTYWLIWKWIVFDTGWIQVKPESSMYSMKWDMCWAATSFAIMKELDEKELNINIVACLCLAENHISWESYKPSDIYTSYSWKTVEIWHTDAEWRLVLADWISYISKNYKTTNIISIATLTWAIVHALWYRYAWIMGDDKAFINKILDNSKTDFEKYIEMPFDDYFIEKTVSEIADLVNINREAKAWASMWAAFLYNFLMNNEKFTHIDIAWTAMNDFEAYWYYPKWITAFWFDSLSKVFTELE